MSRNETIIGVFIASPSDVLEERKAIESIMQELNKTWSKNLNLRLDLIKWETDVYPGFGDYPQDVINKQINNEYDVFIAVFWGKIGSPTQSAESGTIEEFDRAYKRYIEDECSIDIMIYFKDHAIPPSKMDLGQLQKIQKLKERIGEKGGLYSTFDSIENFETRLRFDLSKIAQKWSLKDVAKKGLESEQIRIEEQSEADILDEDEEYGLLDYFEIYEDRMSNMTKAFSIMTKATEKLGRLARTRTKEMNSLQNAIAKPNKRQAKILFKQSSNDLEEFSDIIELQVKTTSKSREEAFDALSKALSIYVDFKESNNSDDLTSLEKSLIFMINATERTRYNISGLRESISNFPRITSQLNRSKRRATKALDGVLEELNTIIQSANDVLEIIKELGSEE